MKFAIVEDDPFALQTLRAALSAVATSISAFDAYVPALAALSTQAFDCALIDIGIPDRQSRDGLDLLNTLRQTFAWKTPTIIVSSVNDAAMIVKLLDAGADDYICKPFDTVILQARVRALMRRQTTETRGERIQFGHITWQRGAAEIAVANNSVELSEMEILLCCELFTQVGTIRPRQKLEARIYAKPKNATNTADVVHTPQSRALDYHVTSLRRKLQLSGEHPHRMVAVYGKGYRLVADGVTG